MKTKEQIEKRIQNVEDYIMERFRKGCNQARLKDIGELQALRWILEDDDGQEEGE